MTTTTKPIPFYMEPWSPGEPCHPGVFCQWASTPFKISGIMYPTAEHYMMACKAAQFDDTDALAEILSTNSPGHAKAVGRRVKGYDDREWNRHRLAVVVRGNLAKFTQHPRLGRYLLSTGDRLIVEASTYDEIWGVGADHVQAMRPTMWCGANLLGFALMTVRDMMRRGAVS